MSVCMGFILPGIVMNWAVEDVSQPQEETLPDSTVPSVTELREQLTMLLRQWDGTVVTMDMEEYLVGVVLGEMPADFED